MARHRFDEGDDQAKWGGPALLKFRQPALVTHEQREERVATEQTSQHELFTSPTPPQR